MKYSITPFYSGRGYYDVTGADGNKYIYVPKEFVEKGFVSGGIQYLNDNFLNPDLLKKASEFKLDNADAITGAAKNLYSNPTNGYVWKYNDLYPYTSDFSLGGYGVSPDTGAITGMSSLNGKPAYAVTTAPGQTASFMTSNGNFTHEQTTITSSGGGGFFGGLLGSIATGMKNLVGGVSDVLHGLGEGVSNTVAGLGQGVSDAIHGIGTTIAKTPLLNTAAVIVLSNYIGPQAAAALVSANAGASPEVIARNMMLAGVTAEVAGQIAPEVAKMTDSNTAGLIAGQTAGAATTSVLTGKDPTQAVLNALVSGGVNAGAGEILKGVDGFKDLTPAQQKAVLTVVASEIQGKDPTTALINQAISVGTKEIENQVDVARRETELAETTRKEEALKETERVEAERLETARIEAERQAEENRQAEAQRQEQARQEALAEEARQQAAALEAQRQAEEARAAAQAEADRQAELARTQRDEEERTKAEELHRIAQEEADRQAEAARQAEEERRRQEEQQPPPVEPEDKPPPVEVPGEDGGTLTVDPKTGSVTVTEPELPDTETPDTETPEEWTPPTDLPPQTTKTGIDNEGADLGGGDVFNLDEFYRSIGIDPSTMKDEPPMSQEDIDAIIRGENVPIETPTGTVNVFKGKVVPTTPAPKTPTNQPTTQPVTQPTTQPTTQPVTQPAQQTNPLGMLALLDILGQQPQQQPQQPQQQGADIRLMENIFGTDFTTPRPEGTKKYSSGGEIEALLHLLRS